MNKTILIGRLTKDPELTFLPGNGTAVARFTLAVNRPRLDKNKPQEADFIQCVCFGKRAEAIANYVRKGHLFSVTGRLQIKKYVDKDGNNRWSTDVLIEDFEFIQSKNSDVATDNMNTTQNQEYQDLTPIDDGEDIPF
ncbi:single-stranded DNA-binding family protein [Clostridium argentinense CDC 2741]|uniref:Single-stranded DNA-binding protein n=1 Tax=Clostridium argentinense CDC 2741 TaxID=1418104 RepID=A0A0C1R9M8_9CLOT|nr:single-stranded DNA-binding protein [Clostridium argentinense]ARC85662.1 single-stranded DNA-binding protein [Clostridium argentinense]KIE47151.1 single-stranded DNA-binding family protein [Clostridium argentinense CDC 2741]NFF40815.1 single-stranded DNA-binding protein [Clostridium argentinense]NFP50747.1 single-stranded DNA-binding protein [Clostridium argentinense]NFP73096.1 single-stranded DNA-binding protein [Clostridium argentinense]